MARPRTDPQSIRRDALLHTHTHVLDSPAAAPHRTAFGSRLHKHFPRQVSRSRDSPLQEDHHSTALYTFGRIGALPLRMHVMPVCGRRVIRRDCILETQAPHRTLRTSSPVPGVGFFSTRCRGWSSPGSSSLVPCIAFGSADRSWTSCPWYAPGPHYTSPK